MLSNPESININSINLMTKSIPKFIESNYNFSNNPKESQSYGFGELIKS